MGYGIGELIGSSRDQDKARTGCSVATMFIWGISIDSAGILTVGSVWWLVKWGTVSKSTRVSGVVERKGMNGWLCWLASLLVDGRRRQWNEQTREERPLNGKRLPRRGNARRDLARFHSAGAGGEAHGSVLVPYTASAPYGSVQILHYERAGGWMGNRNKGMAEAGKAAVWPLAAHLGTTPPLVTYILETSVCSLFDRYNTTQTLYPYQ